MIANRSKLNGNAMRRTFPFLVLMAFAMPAWCARQSGQNPPAPPPSSSSSSSSSPKSAKPTAQPRDIATFDPPNAEKDVDVASYYMRKGDMNAAIPRLQEAVQLKPHYAKARLMLGEAYERVHDKQSRRKHYQEYLKEFPTHPMQRRSRRKSRSCPGSERGRGAQSARSWKHTLHAADEPAQRRRASRASFCRT